MARRHPQPPRSIFKAGDLGELINALPTLFGFPPENSLVAVGLQGPRIFFGMRLDLAEVGEEVDRTADLVVRHLEQQRAEGGITLALGEPLDLGRRLVLAVEARLVRVRPVAGGWASEDRYWLSMAGASPRGYPYRRSLHHPAAAQAVWEGQELAPSRAAMEAAMAPLDGERSAEVQAMAHRVADDLMSKSGPDVNSRPGLEACLATEVAQLVQNRSHLGLATEVAPVLDELRRGRTVSDDRLLRMAFLVSRVKVRDAVWGLITADNARDFVRVWLHVARHVPHAWAPSAYSLAAFSSWMCGDGAKSVMAAEHALRLDPGYSMARLMLELATSGASPRAWRGGVAS